MTLQDLEGDMTLADITDALDDNKDGVADDSAWAMVQASAAERVENAFGGETPAAYAKSAAYAFKVFVLEILYRRRGFTDRANPFTSQANAAEKRLTNLSSGTDRPDAGASGAGEAETVELAATPTTGLMA
jgi:hypothetical protein